MAFQATDDETIALICGPGAHDARTIYRSRVDGRNAVVFVDASLHRVRRASITWTLKQRLSIEAVPQRVNARPSVIRQLSDQAGGADEFEKRRRAGETAHDGPLRAL